MKKIFLFILIIHLIQTQLFSQNLENEIAFEICNCLNKISEEIEYKQLDSKMNDCFLYAYNKSEHNISKYLSGKPKKVKDELEMKVYFLSQYHDLHSFKLFKRSYLESNYKPKRDSLDMEYEKWSSSLVRVSNKPISINQGMFESLEEGPAHSRLIITRDTIQEIMPWNLDTTFFHIEWIEKFKYKTKYLGSKRGFDRFKIGDEFIMKIIEVTNEGFSVLFPTSKGKIVKIAYKKI